MRTSGNIFNKSPLGLILSMHNWHGIVGVVRAVWTIAAGTSSRVNTMARKWWKAERWFYLSGKWKLVDPDPEKGIKSFQCHIQRPGLRLLANVSEDWGLMLGLMQKWNLLCISVLFPYYANVVELDRLGVRSRCICIHLPSNDGFQVERTSR